MQSSSGCASKCNPCFDWDVRQYITSASKMRYAILVLNRPLTQNLNVIKNLWNFATVRVTVDGGTNRWDTYISALSEEVQKSLKNPDLITGDFDSIRNEIMEKYKKKGCKVIHTPDQDFTDFTKALIELDRHCRQNKLEVDNFIALSQSSGRLDQILGNIQTLFLVKEKHIISPKINVFMISDDAISWLLTPGKHVIDVPEEISSLKKSWCSLVPIGETCDIVTTLGLKWNLGTEYKINSRVLADRGASQLSVNKDDFGMRNIPIVLREDAWRNISQEEIPHGDLAWYKKTDNSQLKFGNIVSTSNTYDGLGKVIVKCSHTLLWSMKLLNITDTTNVGNGATPNTPT